MSRMTRSRVKQEPGMSQEPPYEDTPPVNVNNNMLNGSASRPMSIAPTAVNTPTPTLDHHNTPASDHQMASSGDTTIPDGDVEMNGMDAGHASGVAHGTTTGQDAMQALGQHSRQLIQTIQRLELLNIDATLSSLPKFVVVGDQSAGKSSIIEAVCDITVPRDTGTCTRCPFQITTTASRELEAGDWMCKVSLHKKYAYVSSARAGRDPQAYDMWVEQDTTEIVQFATIDDKNLLEDLLRRAQRAILNPGRDPLHFLKGIHAASQTQIDFSPNVISLDISGRDLPEISFFDLPGAINVHEGDEDHLVEFVEKLIKHYVSEETTLVLLACSADQDVENSTAFRYVKQCKAIPRCMGVLTKPDLVTRNRLPFIRRMLNGESFRLGRDWFVTKQLAQEELDLGVGRITHADARARERGFFATDPWSTSLVQFTERFGTANLQSAMSKCLTDHILIELPDIIYRVDEKLKEVSTALKAFPERPRSAAHTVLDESQSVTDLISAHIRGEGIEKADSDFKPQYKDLIRTLATRLKDAKPVVNLRTPGYEKASINIDDDSDNDATPAPMETPSKMRKGNQGLAIRTPQGGSVNRSTPRSARVKAEEDSLAPPPRTIYRLQDVFDMYEHGSTSGLPDQVNPKVTERLALMALGGWETMVRSFLDGLKQHFTTMLLQSINEKLGLRRQTQLYAKTRQTISTFFSALWEEQSKLVRHIIACETYKPITYGGLRTQADPIRAKLLDDRLTERVNEYYDPLDAKGYKVPIAAERMKKRTELEATTLKTDNYRREVCELAMPLAYYEVASTRMVDTIANHLEFGLLHALDVGIRNEVRTALRVTDEEYCVQLLAEDPERERQRARLQSEHEKLTKAMEELKALPQHHDGF